MYKSCEDILETEIRLRELEKNMSREKNVDNLEKMVKEYGKIQEKYLLIGGYEFEQNFKKLCSEFYIDKQLLNQNYNLLSGGEKTRVNLAKLFLAKPDILLLDEPTNHLDISSLEFLEELILKYKGSVLIVSHDRYFLDKVVNKTILLENGKENIYYGNYSYFIKEDERRTIAQFENYKNQQKQIEKMKESIITLRKFGELAGNEMFFKRAKSIEKRLEKITILDKVNLDKKSIDLKFNEKIKFSEDVLKIEHLEKSFDDKIIFKGVNLILNYREKIALIGKNGSGKSTLIKIILNLDNEYQGNLKLGNSIKIGYIPQEIIFKNENLTILDYFLQENKFTETEARCKLAKFGFRQENVFKKVEKLSGGEKVKLMLINLIQKDINFLILDEPTNHIDIDTREILEEALKEYNGTVLFVSHDRFFINSVANRILNIENCEIKSYYGNYDDFINNKN